MSGDLGAVRSTRKWNYCLRAARQVWARWPSLTRLGPGRVALARLAALCVLASRPASAQPLALQRVAVSGRFLLVNSGGQAQELSGEELEALLSGWLRDAGARIVEPRRAQPTGSSLAPQRAGGEPGEVQRVLVDPVGVDAVYTALLSCTETGRLPHGPDSEGLLGVRCDLSLKVVRGDSGDVVAQATSPGLFGLDTTAVGAAGSVLRHQGNRDKLNAAAREGTDKWRASMELWSLDLAISGLHERSQIEALLQRLRGESGVSAARVVRREQDLVQMALGGVGATTQAALVAKLETDPRYAMSITYESPAVVAAYYDVSRTMPQAVGVYALVEPSLGSAQAEEVLRAQVEGLPFLQALRPVILRGQEWPAAELRQSASAQRVDWVLLVRLRLQSSKDWVVTCNLREVATGTDYLASAGTGGDSLAALKVAFSDFAHHYRQAWRNPKLQPVLWPGSALRVAKRAELELEEFRIERQQGGPQGLFVLRNMTAEPLRGVEARLVTASGHPLGVWSMDELAPEARARQLVPLSEVPAGADGAAAPLQVLLTYDQAGLRRSLVHPLATDAALASGAPSDESIAASGTGGDEGVPDGYSRLVRVAQGHYDRGDFGQALQVMRAAYQRYPTGKGGRLLGWIEFALKSPLAESHLRESLEESRLPLDDAQKRHVRSMLEQIERTRGLRWAGVANTAASERH